ncbi:SH3 domain-containing kinase-binding protein 1-like isoform X4 [Hemitrygon akajei]|uniref:SH3 domain-containing kinase-binding protein 1-like isoform X4 n=1 Tax=Hemitrygon akajei TaxID=2704970 RepID=UPI003BFA1C02
MEFVAVSCYDTKVEEELSLQTGDIIRNSKCTDKKGWWEGELNGKWGRFPRVFVEEVPSQLVTDRKPLQPRSLRRRHVVKKKLRLCEVVISYSPVRPEQLELSVGEVIEVLREVESGWWLGRKNGKTGCFPSNFVVEVDRAEGSSRKEQEGPSSDLYANFPLDSEKMLVSGTAGESKEPASGSAHPQEDDGCVEETGQKMGSSRKEQEGPSSDLYANFPLDSEKMLVSGTAGESKEPASGSAHPQEDDGCVEETGQKIAKEYYEAVSDYDAGAEDELSLHKGDVILVLEKDTGEEGWWQGYVNGNEGLFPDNYVVPYAGTKAVQKEPSPGDTTVAEILNRAHTTWWSNAIYNSAKEYYKAASDYVATTEDELSLHEGDVILVSEKDTGEGGWWKACVNGQQGLIPDRLMVPYAGTEEVKQELLPADVMDAGIYEKKEPKTGRSESAVKHNLMPPRKVPPPVKVKPLLTSLSKVGGEQAPTPRELGKPARERSSDSESLTFDTVVPSAQTLQHLTADRPRAQGRRPPTHLRAAAANAEGSVSPLVPAKVKPPPAQLFEPPAIQRHQSTAARAGPVPASPPNKTQRHEERGDKVDPVAGLQEELKSLKLSINLLKNQYSRDVIDLKEEIAKERLKWHTLQMEVENLRKLMTSLPEH